MSIRSNLAKAVLVGAVFLAGPAFAEPLKVVYRIYAVVVNDAPTIPGLPADKGTLRKESEVPSFGHPPFSLEQVKKDAALAKLATKDQLDKHVEIRSIRWTGTLRDWITLAIPQPGKGPLIGWVCESILSDGTPLSALHSGDNRLLDADEEREDHGQLLADPRP